MKIVQATRFGDPEVLVATDAPDPDPEPGAGQVVIAVEAAEVIFLDTQLRAGWGSDFFPLDPPYVPGTGVAGQIAGVGAGVDADRVGTRIVARTGQTGGYVERLVVADSEAYGIPDGVDRFVALAALHDGPTALSRLDAALIQPGERVLVTAAAGSLGAWLVTLAKAAGATVIAAASSGPKLEQARSFGADEALDYSQDGWAKRIGAPVDVVFDGTGGDIGSAASEHTADGGRFFSYGAASGDFAAIDEQAMQKRQITVTGIGDPLTDEQWRSLTRRSLEALESRDVAPVIGQVVPLHRAADAHSAMADRTVLGKTVLQVGA